MAIAHRYTRPDQYYTSSAEDHGYPPYNSTPATLPPRPWGCKWPQYVNGKWKLVEDHRQRAEPQFASEDVQKGTGYWLLDDTHDTPERYMYTPGPLPKDAVTTRPDKSVDVLLAESRASKTAQIVDGYDAAVAASLTIPMATPTAQDVTIGAAAFAAEDAEGLAYVMHAHAAHRDALLAAVAAADTADAVAAIAVSYAV